MSHLYMPSVDKLLHYATLKSLAYLFVGTILFKFAQWSYWPIRKLFSPLRRLPGPVNESLIFGNLKLIFSSPNVVVHEEWVKNHGPTFAYRGFLSVSLSLLDVHS
jgi:hypothetical protein